MVKRFAMFLCVLVVASAATSASAAASEPAVTQVQALTGALLKAMKAGPHVSMTERYRQLKPVVERTFALPFMTRLSVGPDWAKFSPQ
ncbi:MAG: ABC transporter substrate-binding protein, partial [Steroidobacteraceae bacterium]